MLDKILFKKPRNPLETGEGQAAAERPVEPAAR